MSTPCARPLADDLLLDWWAGELAPGERRRVEEHLLACTTCAERGRSIDELARGVRGLVREGALPAVLLPAAVDRMRGEGRRIREYRVRPGAGVQCTVGPDDDVVLGRLAADLRGVARVDLVSRIDDGPEQRVSDLPFDPAGSEVILAPSVDELRARPRHVQRVRLLAVGPEGERLLGEYRFDHTPWPGARP